MNFTLTYDGDLKSNGNVKHKHAIRRAFHSQLSQFWGDTFLGSENSLNSLTTRLGGYRFFPLVSEARNETAELQVLMLRPGKGPGFIVGQGGDIDNRLKTLFDSLRMPENESEIPKNDLPKENEDPFFCLLQDDILITSLSVSTDRLLEPCNSDSHVKLIVHVQIKQVPIIGSNMMISIG